MTERRLEEDARRRRTASGGILAVSLLALLAAGSARATVVFSDSFTEATLNPEWQVLGGQGSYTMTGSSLRYFNDGPLSSPTTWSTTSMALALPFTGTRWTATIEATYNLYWLLPGYGSYNGPAQPTYSGSPGAQEPRVLMAFAPVTAGDRSALTNPNNVATFARNIDPYYGSDTLTAQYGGSTSANLLTPAEMMITNTIADGTYWLQFTRNGGSLTMSYSTDGTNYQTAYSAMLADPSNDYNELLLTGLTYLTAGSFTDYKNLTITAPDAVPEPASIGLLVTVVAALGLRIRRKARAA